MDPVETAMNIKQTISKYLALYSKMTKQQIVEDRYKKIRAMGIFEETVVKQAQKNKATKEAKNKKK